MVPDLLPVHPHAALPTDQSPACPPPDAQALIPSLAASLRLPLSTSVLERAPLPAQARPSDLESAPVRTSPSASPAPAAPASGQGSVQSVAQPPAAASPRPPQAPASTPPFPPAHCAPGTRPARPTPPAPEEAIAGPLPSPEPSSLALLFAHTRLTQTRLAHIRFRGQAALLRLGNARCQFLQLAVAEHLQVHHAHQQRFY